MVERRCPLKEWHLGRVQCHHRQEEQLSRLLQRWGKAHTIKTSVREREAFTGLEAIL